MDMLARHPCMSGASPDAVSSRRRHSHAYIVLDDDISSLGRVDQRQVIAVVRRVLCQQARLRGARVLVKLDGVLELPVGHQVPAGKGSDLCTNLHINLAPGSVQWPPRAFAQGAQLPAKRRQTILVVLKAAVAPHPFEDLVLGPRPLPDAHLCRHYDAG